LAALAAAFAAAGSNEQAKELLSQLERSRPQQYVLPYNIAKIYAAARNKSKAFDWLDKAYDEGNPDLIELNSEPIFDGIRRDARFLDLERRVGWNV